MEPILQPRMVGMGLFSISKRIEELGGKVEISTQDGFRIFATIYKKD